jgi:hypothetical protein
VTNSELLLIVACVLFAVGGTIRLLARSVDGALVAFGLACTALAFVVVS